jgi:CHAT domain-containing protein
MLVEPAKKLIPPGSRVILLPDSSLYGLNFETLIVPGAQPHFWIEDVTLTTANSLTLLASSATRPVPKERTLLLMGNAEQADPKFPPLAQAPAEMKNVKNYFPGQDRNVLEGKQATPSAYLSSNPERFAYLHFVTHGTASRTRPLESAVILSKEGDSYKLYARDIVQHHLNASLVTISACNGAGMRTYSGEGLVGLSWAFLRAGAHDVIGALWEVSDASTPQLMDSLYEGLSRGKDPATALRDAKLSFLHSTDSGSVFKKPFYWAPFQLYAGS